MKSVEAALQAFDKILSNAELDPDINRDCTKTYAQMQIAIALLRIADVMEREEGQQNAEETEV